MTVDGSTFDLDHPPDADPSRLPDMRLTGLAYAIAGGIGLAAAFTLAIDKYRILADPAFTPACDLNPVLSCGSVMTTDQAEAFGFPNPLVGIAAFTVVVVVGVLLTARVALPRWVHVGLSLGSLLGAVFVHWLAYQSLYEIGALCPWCLGVWVVTLFLATWTTLRLGLLGARDPGGWAERVWSARFLALLIWYLLFAVAILERFWDYWSSLL